MRLEATPDGKSLLLIDVDSRKPGVETSDRYLAIPHKNDLDLGRSRALRFVAQELPARYDQVEGFFRRQGDSRFKDLLEREGVLEAWYACEADSVASTPRQWGAENGIEILET